MAGVSPGVAVAGPLNDLMGVLYTARLPLPAGGSEACAAAADAIAAVMEHLKDPSATLTDTTMLEGRLRALADQAAEAAASAEAAEGGTLSVEVPGVKIPLTPAACRGPMSSSGMMPPPKTTMSGAPCSRSSSSTRGNR